MREGSSNFQNFEFIYFYWSFQLQMHGANFHLEFAMEIYLDMDHFRNVFTSNKMELATKHNIALQSWSFYLSNRLFQIAFGRCKLKGQIHCIRLKNWLLKAENSFSSTCFMRRGDEWQWKCKNFKRAKKQKWFEKWKRVPCNLNQGKDLWTLWKLQNGWISSDINIDNLCQPFEMNKKNQN